MHSPTGSEFEAFPPALKRKVCTLFISYLMIFFALFHATCQLDSLLDLEHCIHAELDSRPCWVDCLASGDE